MLEIRHLFSSQNGILKHNARGYFIKFLEKRKICDLLLQVGSDCMSYSILTSHLYVNYCTAKCV